MAQITETLYFKLEESARAYVERFKAAYGDRVLWRSGYHQPAQ